LILTEDSETQFFGTEWNILRASQSLTSASDVYVYPNPFSPDDEVARVHYLMEGTGSVSIRIFDYAMFPVRTLLQNADRLSGLEHDEIWDGKNDSGKQVANGIYYVEVTIGDNDPAWGKIIVLQ